MVGIYKITSPSGRVYIGQSMDIEKRWKEYRTNPKKGQRLLYHSLLKYGSDNHIFEVVYELPKDIDESILNTYETLYISEYQSNISKYRSGVGMNLTDGGDGNRGHKHTEEFKQKQRERKLGKKRGPMSEKTKERIRQSSFGRSCSESFKQACSERMKGKPGFMNGKIQSKESMLMQMKSKIGYERKIEIFNRITNIKIGECHFSSEAEVLTGVSKGSVQNNLVGKSRRAGEFIFKYKIIQ